MGLGCRVCFWSLDSICTGLLEFQGWQKTCMGRLESWQHGGFGGARKPMFLDRSVVIRCDIGGGGGAQMLVVRLLKTRIAVAWQDSCCWGLSNIFLAWLCTIVSVAADDDVRRSHRHWWP